MHNLWRLLNNNSMKTKGRSNYNFKSWPSVFHKVYLWELASFLVSQTLCPRPQYAWYSDLFCVFLVTKSLPDLFLILGIIRSPIFVDPFPVVFTVLSLVISDVFFVFLTIGSLAAGEPFPVVFIPPFTTWFEKSRRSRYDNVFARPGFALCSFHNIFFYGKLSYKQPSSHSPTAD